MRSWCRNIVVYVTLETLQITSTNPLQKILSTPLKQVKLKFAVFGLLKSSMINCNVF